MKLLQVPAAPVPYTLAGKSSRSAFLNFAADTIFMDLVIFWIFFTDFSLRATRENQYRHNVIQIESEV